MGVVRGFTKFGLNTNIYIIVSYMLTSEYIKDEQEYVWYVKTMLESEGIRYKRKCEGGVRNMGVASL